jgi:hypothetical protein
MALRLLARQGKTYLPEAQRIAAGDGDELVRELAGSFVLRWTTEGASATSKPGDR